MKLLITMSDNSINSWKIYVYMYNQSVLCMVDQFDLDHSIIQPKSILRMSLCSKPFKSNEKVSEPGNDKQTGLSVCMEAQSREF